MSLLKMPGYVRAMGIAWAQPEVRHHARFLNEGQQNGCCEFCLGLLGLQSMVVPCCDPQRVMTVESISRVSRSILNRSKKPAINLFLHLFVSVHIKTIEPGNGS
jgi:hypothetical protein